MTPADHKAFELQISRIHELLDADDAIVTWNDRIIDPDNSSQLRQIDVTIKRGDALTLVECRIHKKRQDAKWVEELIGRRVSLNAEAVIAVSASGFTGTARKKAERFGIHLRQLGDLTDDEIRSWGRRRKFRISFIECRDVRVLVRVPSELGSERPKLTDSAGRALSSLSYHILFQTLRDRLDEIGWSGVPTRLQVEIAQFLLVNGLVPKSVTLTATVRRIEQEGKRHADPLLPLAI